MSTTGPNPPREPSLPWRTASSVVMGLVGTISRTFLYGFNKTETVGLDKFMAILDNRRDVDTRTRGLLTVSNHISVVDDPLIWGVLPLRYDFNPSNERWTLGSHDICFKNKAVSTFFTLGQTLPTHRSRHSTFGGLFQPTMTQAIRLLCAQPFSQTDPQGLSTSPATRSSKNPSSPDLDDPFTSGSLTYSTNGSDTYPAPSAYLSRRHSWVHIFPEGYIHQHPLKIMKYFRWGVSRLILESDPLPIIVPMWIDGTQECMHESREFPRFLPRIGKKIRIAFGDEVDGEEIFGEARRKWKRLVDMQKEALRKKGRGSEMSLGELTEGLKFADEAVALRKEVSKLVREEVLKVRKSLGYPDEDPKNGLVETWALEGPKNEGKMEDGSWVKDI